MVARKREQRGDVGGEDIGREGSGQLYHDAIGRGGVCE